MQTLILILAVATAVMGGVFFAFSAFVMTALGKLKSAEGIRAMQRINVDVLSWPFMSLFFGVPVVLLVVVVYAISNYTQTGSYYLLAASGTYWAGSFLLTIFGNVPLNNKLARINPDDKQSDGVWQHYLVYWLRWNHVRTLACVLACVFLLLASL